MADILKKLSSCRGAECCWRWGLSGRDDGWKEEEEEAEEEVAVTEVLGYWGRVLV